jgi:multisubunit Na+/H+ antiporter MnhG subunit
MSWFRASSLIFAGWAVVFFIFPRFTNELAAVGYISSGHAEDWTQIVGLFCLAFAVLLHEAHRSASAAVRRIVARGAVVLTLPCALLMTYWQIVPDGRWFRLDIANIALLYLISYGMFLHGGWPWRRDLR